MSLFNSKKRCKIERYIIFGKLYAVDPMVQTEKINYLGNM